MAQQSDKDHPEVVRRTCRRFLTALNAYQRLLQESIDQREETPDDDDSPLPNLGPARTLWKPVDRLGRKLLKAGTNWTMGQWVSSHDEFLRLETAGFFEDAGLAEEADGEIRWGLDLRLFLEWSKRRGTPFGFSGYEYEDGQDMQEWVLEDVRRDVRALIAASNERSVKLPGTGEDQQVLLPREEAIYKLIPRRTGRNGLVGITGAAIINKLSSISSYKVSQSVLTKYIMAKLRTPIWGVMNDHDGIGYYRIK